MASGFLKQKIERDATKALLLLGEMNTDLWWKRAWIFQESYRAGEKLALLIPHDASLEVQKKSYVDRFGDLRGELC